MLHGCQILKNLKLNTKEIKMTFMNILTIFHKVQCEMLYFGRVANDFADWFKQGYRFSHGLKVFTSL